MAHEERNRELIIVDYAPDPYGDLAVANQKTRLIYENKTMKSMSDTLRKQQKEIKQAWKQVKEQIKNKQR